MKKVAVIVLIAISVILCACQTEKGENEAYSYCINGRQIYFVNDEARKEWVEPLKKLLSNVYVDCNSVDGNGNEPSTDPNAPAIVDGYSCGLLDITSDGVPELLVHPLGCFGSSGTATYFIYDIYTGQYIGEIDDGLGLLPWCEYYYTQTDEFQLVGQYWLRYGWPARDRFIYVTKYNEEKGQYGQKSYFRTYHEVEHKETISTEDEDMIIVTEIYPETCYYVYGKIATIDEYYDEFEWFTQNCIRIRETELKLFRWEDVTEDGDDYVTRGEKMAEALVSSDQEFIDFKK